MHPIVNEDILYVLDKALERFLNSDKIRMYDGFTIRHTRSDGSLNFLFVGPIETRISSGGK